MSPCPPLSSSENGRTPLDKSELKRFANRVKTKIERTLQRTLTDNRVVTDHKFVKKVRRTADEIWRVCGEVEEGPVSKEKMTGICLLIDQAIQRFEREGELDSGVRQIFGETMETFSELRRSFSETFEIKTAAQIEAERKQEQPKTFVQFMEQDVGIPAKGISSCIVTTVGQQARHYAEYFLSTLARDTRLKFGEKLSKHDLDSILNIFKKLEVHARTECDRALAASISFQEFWTRFKNGMSQFRTDNPLIDKHFQTEVIQVFCDMVQSPADLWCLIQSKDEIPVYDEKTVLEVICPDRVLAIQEEDFELPISEDEIKGVLELLTTFGDFEDIPEDLYQVAADRINSQWHGGIELRTAEDIRHIAEEKGVESTKPSESKAEIESQAPDSIRHILDLSEEAARLSAQGKVSSAEDTDGKPTTIPELHIIQQTIAHLANDLQTQADYHRICSTLILWQRTLKVEAIKYHGMRHPDPEAISQMETDAAAISEELEPLLGEMKEDGQQLANSRSGIHMAMTMILSGKHKPENLTQQKADLEEFLELYKDYERKLDRARTLADSLKGLQSNNAEMTENVRRGSKFVEKDLRAKASGINPKDLFMSKDQYLLESDPEIPNKLAHIEDAIRNMRTAMEEIEVLTAELPRDYRDKAKDTLKNFGNATESEKGASAEKPPVPETKKVEVTIGESAVIDSDSGIRRCRMEFNGEILQFSFATLAAARILHCMGELNNQYYLILRLPMVLASYVSSVFPDFQSLRSNPNAMNQLTEIIEIELLQISEEVEGTNKISQAARNQVKRPVVRATKTLYKGKTEGYVASSTIEAFLNHAPIKTELSQEQKAILEGRIRESRDKNRRLQGRDEKKSRFKIGEDKENNK